MLPLRLERGQEFVYDAQYTQESERPGSRFSRSLKTHALILDVDAAGSAQVAFMTEQRVEGKPGEEATSLAHLSLGRVDTLGRVRLESMTGSSRLPIDGAPTLETLPFVEWPRERVEPGHTWTVEDPELGPQTWRLLNQELRDLGRCFKLKARQSSGDWNRVDRVVWRREDDASVLVVEGYVSHWERRTEWRTVSGDLFKSTTVLNLSAIPGPLTDGAIRARRLEIAEASRFAARLAELMKPRGEPDIQGYTNLLHDIDRYQSRGTPYYAAIQSVRRRAELARRGERPPEPIVIRVGRDTPAIPKSPRAADIDDPAPSIGLTNVRNGEQQLLASLRGKPVLLVFFKPTSPLIDVTLRYLRRTAPYRDAVHVVPVAVDGSRDDIEKLRAAHKLPGDVFESRTALAQFAGRSTPRFIVIDKRGIIRLMLPGWNGEFPEQIHKELESILAAKP